MAKMSRRTVYIGTIVAMFAMASGFVVASISVGGYNTVVNNYAPGTTTVNYYTTQWTTTGVATIINTPVGLTSAEATGGTCVLGLSAGTCTAGNVDDQAVSYPFVTPNPTTCPATPLDTYSVVTTTGAGSFTSTFTTNACSPTGTSLTLYIDLGTGPVTLTSVAVTVSGNY
jgi:hypothetical protein